MRRVLRWISLSLLLSCSQIDGRPSAPSAPPRVAASSPSERATSQDAKPAVALPEPANTSGTAIAEQEPGTADLDPNNDEIVAPPEAIADCEARLNALGVSYAAAELKLRTLPGGRVCGAPQALVYKGRPGGIRWSPPPIVTCNLAIALAHFELVVDAEAKQYLGTSVRSIEQGGTYNCRTMARFSNMVSEHSYGNAIDLRRFRLSDGRTVSVLEHFGRPANEPSAAQVSSCARSRVRRSTTASSRSYSPNSSTASIATTSTSIWRAIASTARAERRADTAPPRNSSDGRQ